MSLPLSWFALPNWFDHRPVLAEPLQQRLARWQTLPPTSLETPFAGARYVVVDTETSGLNPATDRLLSIGAIGIQSRRIVLADSFESVLGQPRPSTRENIIVHGIGEAAQRDGEDIREGLVRFLEFVGKAPLLAYHAPFDAAMLQRALRQHLGIAPRLRWLDLALILPPLYEGKPRQALDHWLERFGIDVPMRHSALGDALATAQLAQLAMHQADARGLINFKALSTLAGASRWLTP